MSSPSTPAASDDESGGGDTQTLVLPCGRSLGFASYGSPTGFPVVFLHGWPSSRLEGVGASSAALRHGVRLLALDRPGFGVSSPLAGAGIGPRATRHVANFARDDVRAFADALGLRRFSVLGGSGGGPYALACARFLPADRLAGVALLGSAGLWDGDARKSVPRVSRAVGWLAAWMPWALGALARAAVGVAKWMASTKVGVRWLDAALVKLAEAEKTAAAEKKRATGADQDATDPTPADEAAEDPETSIAERRERVLRVAFEGFAQGPGAFVQEAQMLASADWGFRLEDVSYGPIHIWHGTRDANSPIDVVRPMARRLPHAVLKETDDTHYTMHRYLDEIFEALVPPDAKRSAEKAGEKS